MRKPLTLILLFILFGVMAYASLSNAVKKNNREKMEKKAGTGQTACRRVCLFS